MRLHRFYISQPLGEEVVIDNVSLVHQWKHVFRYSDGDSIILFNSDGYDYTYVVRKLTKESAILSQAESLPVYIPSKKVTLCLSILKKDNFELASEKATELGISSIVPVLSSRSEKKNISESRLIKIITEASEQCGRGDIPHLLPITPLREALIHAQEKGTSIVLDMQGVPLRNHMPTNNNEELFLFIGPEGGWSTEDLLLFEEFSVSRFSLGKTTLRAETAAIVASSFLIH